MKRQFIANASFCLYKICNLINIDEGLVVAMEMYFCSDIYTKSMYCW